MSMQKIRVGIQILGFILIPELFISIFGAIEEIYKAVISGSFALAALWPDILLIAVVVIATVIWGRFFCGFLCSFGAMQDLLYLAGKHLPFKPHLPEKADRVLKYLKYAVLLFIVLGIWTFALPGDMVWSPWTVFGMYAAFWKGLPAQAVFLSLGGALLLITMAGSLFVERFFCKYLCPMGAVFALLSRFRVFRIKKPAGECGNCRSCTGKCSMSIPLYKYERVDSGECINCMKCTESCPRQNVRLAPAPLVTGLVAAAAVAGVSMVGSLPTPVFAGEASESSSVAETEANVLKDGTYTGSGSGFRGETSVSVKVESGKITDISVESYSDDKKYFDKAESRIISEIIETQSTEVDTVGGATYSSKGIISAVDNALVAAGKTPSVSKETQPESTMVAPTEHKHERNGDGNGERNGEGRRKKQR
ncbi:MAG: 4Fe-4S binding protein [Lachnospiraceae bacterium]|nr:4Fe-4S binding protein [Lachnospiraceae bacterium]